MTSTGQTIVMLQRDKLYSALLTVTLNGYLRVIEEYKRIEKQFTNSCIPNNEAIYSQLKIYEQKF